MELTREDLAWAVREGFLTHEAAERLWARLEERAAAGASVTVSPATGRVHVDALPAPAARFDLVHVAWYAGTLLILGAMGWFATLGFEAWGGGGILVIAAIYGLLFFGIGLKLWRSADRKVLGALLVTAAVGMVPLAVYGFERAVGLWPDKDPGSYAGFYDWVKGGWFAMELASIAAGVLAFRVVRFPFVGLPVAISVWFLSMDIAPLLFGDDVSYRERALVSLVVGLACVALAWVIRLRKDNEHARFLYWIEVFGLVTFDGGLSQLDSGSMIGKVVVLWLHLAMVALFLRARHGAYVVFGMVGALGMCALSLSQYEGKEVLAVACALSVFAFGLWLAHRARKPGAPFSFPLLAHVLFVAGTITLSIALFTPLERAGLIGVYALVALALVVFGVFVRSRASVGVAGIGLASFLVYLANRVFSDSMVFPIVLVSIGLLVIGAGVFLQKRRALIDGWIESRLPPFLSGLRPPT